MLKAENLQRTGSFKIRGALAKLAALGDACAAGVVCGSAGNHAPGASPYAARARGVPCDVFMPEAAPIAKVEAASGARARTCSMVGATVDEALGPRARDGRRARAAWRSCTRSTIRT